MIRPSDQLDKFLKVRGLPPMRPFQRDLFNRFVLSGRPVMLAPPSPSAERRRWRKAYAEWRRNVYNE